MRVNFVLETRSGEKTVVQYLSWRAYVDVLRVYRWSFRRLSLPGMGSRFLRDSSWT